MDIINKLPEKKFNEIDDLLTFISIYDDYNRTHAYYAMLEDNKWFIKDKVCVELGAGLGLMAEKMAQLGAKKVYAIEKNPYLFAMAQKRLAKYPQIIVLNQDALEFIPEEKVSVLVYDFFGQMLYDEDLYIIENLKWKPDIFLPDGAKLMGGITNIDEFEDEIVNKDFLPALKDILISGLFSEEDIPLSFEVLNFDVHTPFQKSKIVDISHLKGDLLYFGLQITYHGENLCTAGICSNWSYVWTYRYGNKFKIEFEKSDRAPEVIFSWVE